jgi:opacity protein-like surface antigen
MRIDCFSGMSGYRPKSRILPGLIFAAAISSSSGAFAQCVVTGGTAGNNPFLSSYTQSASTAAGSIAGTLGNLSTAFQTQQGSAFVSAPSDPKPDQPGGGVWARGVGGEVTNKFTTNSSSVLGGTNIFVVGNSPSVTQTTNCSGSVHQSFAGMQVGTDISRLNWAGWNVHLGVTSGYLASHAFANNGSASDFEVPFLGGYVVATYGRFFADLMVRQEFYNGSMTDFSFGTYNQRFEGQGISVSTSAGYNFPLANNWFIEPSGGFIWSRATVDNFNVAQPLVSAGAGFNTFVPGVLNSQVSTVPIMSDIGRLSLRAGTTMTSGNVIFQPFVSASVFSEFAGNVMTSVATPAQGATAVATFSNTNSTSRVGTYGQYSVGVAAQFAHTGWLGFARVDYRNGANIEGWTGNAGVRYQFSPEDIAGVMPTKAPVKAPGMANSSTNWTGLYVGGFTGAAFGKTDMRFVGDPSPNDGNNPRAAGFLGGAQLGYNYQFINHWVLGVEGEFGATNFKGTGPCGSGGRDPNGVPTGAFTSSLFTCENDVNWIATAAARIGYSWERTLFFVKAGGAWADDKVSGTCNLGPENGSFQNRIFSSCAVQGATSNGFSLSPVSNGFSNSGHRAGWVVGTGFEFDIGHNWSAKAEYDYIDLGSRSALSTDGTTITRDTGAINQVKVGVNYHFMPLALVAR